MLKNILFKRIIIALSALSAILIIALIMWGWRMGAFSIMPLDINYC